MFKLKKRITREFTPLPSAPTLKRRYEDSGFTPIPSAPVLKRVIRYDAQVFEAQPSAPKLRRREDFTVSPFDEEVGGLIRNKRKKPLEDDEKIWHYDPAFGMLVAYDRATQLRFYLTSRELERSKDFNIQRVVFEFSVQAHPTKPIPVHVVQRCVTQAVANGLRHIQKMYTVKPGWTSRVFAVITDSDRKLKNGSGTDKIHSGDEVVMGQTHATRTGNYRLFDNPDETAKEMLENLAAYMRSNASFNIRFGFYMSLTVVHTRDKDHQASDDDEDIVRNNAGARTEASFLTDYGLTKTGRSTYEPPNELDNMCLPVSILYGYCHALHSSYRKLINKKKKIQTLPLDEQNALDELTASTYRKLYDKIQRTIYDIEDEKQNAREKTKRVYALKQLKTALKHLLQQTNLQSCATFDYQKEGAIIADYLKVQFYVYSRIGNKLVYKYPHERDISRPTIMLYYQQYPNKVIGHISLILCKSFFDHKFYCPYCNKSVLHRQKRHWCANSCRACRGYMRNDGETKIFFSETSLHICDRRTDQQKESIKCPKCGSTCYGRKCLEAHAESSACSTGFVCDICNIRARKTKIIDTFEKFKKEHKCFQVMCKLCWTLYDEREEHYCFLRSIKRQEYYPNLAFFDTETVALDESPAGCKDCVEKEIAYLSKNKIMHLSTKAIQSRCEKDNSFSEIRCKKHLTSQVLRDYHRVNALSFYYEDKKPGHFNRIAMYSPELNMPDDCVVEENVLISEYTVTNLKHDQLDFKVQRSRKGGFGRKSKKKKHVINETESDESGESDVENSGQTSNNGNDDDEEEEEVDDFEDDEIEYIDTDDEDEKEQERTAEDLTVSSGTEEEEGEEERESDRDFIDDESVGDINSNSEYDDDDDDADDDDEKEEEEEQEQEQEQEQEEEEEEEEICDDDDDDDEDSNRETRQGKTRKKQNQVQTKQKQATKTLKQIKKNVTHKKQKQVQTKQKQATKTLKQIKKNVTTKTPKLNLITSTSDKKQTPVQKFLMFILQERFRNYVIFSHNGQSFDHQLIVEEAYNIGLTPTILTNGQKVLTIVFTEYNIRFLDFMLYKVGSLASLAARENIPQQKIDFPFGFNRPQNYEYSGPLPDNKHFEKAFETEEKRNKRNALLNQKRASGETWTFKTELKKYVHSDVHILTLLATKFAKECFNFQKLCSKEFLKDDRDIKCYKSHPKPYLHPYGSQFLTISGYTFGTYRFFQLKKYPLYVIPDEKGSGRINTSKKEGEWVQWIQHEHPNEVIESFHTSNKAPAVKETRPDLLIRNLDTVGHFRGCVIHGHFNSKGEGCELLKGKTIHDKNIYNETYVEMKRKHFRHKQTLKKEGFTKELLMYEVCIFKYSH